jgi:hypothetical protein
MPSCSRRIKIILILSNSLKYPSSNGDAISWLVFTFGFNRRGRIERFLEDQAPRPPPSPLSPRQVVSLSQSTYVTTDGRAYYNERGRGGERSPIIRHGKAWPSINHAIWYRGRPFANAANSYVEFPACKSQKFGHWANIRPLLEKAKKLTICIGNSAPLRTFFLKNLEKFDYRFLRKQKLFFCPF